MGRGRKAVVAEIPVGAGFFLFNFCNAYPSKCALRSLPFDSIHNKMVGLMAQQDTKVLYEQTLVQN